MDPRFHLSRILRRLHWLGLVTLACGAGGLAVSRTLPPVYHAEARLVVAPLPDIANPALQSGAQDHLQLVQQRALTRDALAALSQRVKLADGATIAARVSVTPSLPQPSTTRSPLAAIPVTVGFDAPESALAAQGANGIAALLVAEDRAIHGDIAAHRVAAAETEMARLSALVSESSAAVLEYRKAHADTLPDSLAFRRDRQSHMQDALAQAQADRAALSDRRDRMLRVTSAARQANAPILVPDRIQPAPAVAKASRAADIELARADAQLDALDEKIGQIRTDLVALDATIAATPTHAVALSRLEHELTARQAQLAEASTLHARAEAQAPLLQAGRISIVEPAFAPIGPSSPNRTQVVGAGLGAGMVLGLALIALMGLLRPSIDRPADLAHALGLAPFATLPYLPAPTGPSRIRTMVLIAGVLTATGAAYAVYRSGLGVDQIVALGLRQMH